MFLSAGQTSDYIGARVLPQAGALLADRGYDADWFRNALIEMGISPCIPSRAGRKVQIPHDAELYRLRHKIENMFARLKDCGASQPATTDARSCSFPPAPSQPPS